MPALHLVLASASPARRALLAAAGIDAKVIFSGVDENDVSPDDPAAMVATLARRKAEAVVARLADPTVATGMGATNGIVVGADSALVIDGMACGKPGSAEAVSARWERLRDATGVLMTGHHLVDIDTGMVATAVASTVVHFACPSDEEIAAYIATGEPQVVAGGFTLDGYGAAFVRSIEGEASNVIGLSLPLLRVLLADLGIAWISLWR